MIKLLADENLDNTIIRGLLRRNQDIDIVRVQDIGLSGENDPVVLEWAADNEISHYNLSLAYHRLQQPAQAQIHGKQATVLEPNNPHTWVALALVYKQKNDLELAKKNYNKAIALDGRYGQHKFLDNLERAGFTQEQIQETKTILNLSKE
ncbi:MAG: DUF5615 family PIN-like protein [Crocosphaera sp.]